MSESAVTEIKTEVQEAQLSPAEVAWKEALHVANSKIVPEWMRGDPDSCLVLGDMSKRTGIPFLTLAQNVHMIHGKPGFSATLMIGALNACGRFSPIRYRLTGTQLEDDRTCVAYCKDLETGEDLEGPPVSIAMAKAEGWWSKISRKGVETSKWQTMPELMIRYRSATFFCRLYAPEMLMGFRTTDELEDIEKPPRDARPNAIAARAALSADVPTIDAQTGEVIDEGSAVVE